MGHHRKQGFFDGFESNPFLSHNPCRSTRIGFSNDNARAVSVATTGIEFSKDKVWAVLTKPNPCSSPLSARIGDHLHGLVIRKDLLAGEQIKTSMVFQSGGFTPDDISDR